jgi:hypothetical protein
MRTPFGPRPPFINVARICRKSCAVQTAESARGRIIFWRMGAHSCRLLRCGAEPRRSCLSSAHRARSSSRSEPMVWGLTSERALAAGTSPFRHPTGAARLRAPGARPDRLGRMRSRRAQEAQRCVLRTYRSTPSPRHERPRSTHFGTIRRASSRSLVPGRYRPNPCLRDQRCYVTAQTRRGVVAH